MGTKAATAGRRTHRTRALSPSVRGAAAADSRGAARSSPQLPMLVRVRSLRSETGDVFTLVLEPPTPGTAPFAFEPGQFNMLYPFGVGEAAISLSGDAGDPFCVTHTIRAVGSVTRALARLRPGDTLGLRGPYGSPWPLRAAKGKDLILVAGGIGLAPLRPVLYEVLRRRGDFGQVALLVGMRSPADIIYADELAAWSRRGEVQVLVAVAHADVDWRGRVGLVTSLLPQAQFSARRAVGLLCGPEIMMRFAARDLLQRGVPVEQMYLALERNMQCAVGFCGHCQFGPSFVCMDGPVFRYDRIQRFFDLAEA